MSSAADTAAAHPRSRGENSAMAAFCSATLGSSPLTRGKLLAHDGLVFALGLIPAHAGKTRKRAGDTGSSGAHPRSRGENRNARILGNKLGGSSPLTRGKLENIPAACELGGLIPAHAGKTSQAEETLRPRTGSSPLTRGKRRDTARGCARAGLIPAHAGKTNQVIGRYGTVWAHPRSRGENS